MASCGPRRGWGSWTAFSWDELWRILAVIALGAVAGVLPAVKAARTQVADNLAPTT